MEKIRGPSLTLIRGCCEVFGRIDTPVGTSCAAGSSDGSLSTYLRFGGVETQSASFSIYHSLV